LTDLITGSTTAGPESEQGRYYLASQWRLMWRKLRRHRLAVVSSALLLLLYLVAVFSGFFAPYDIYARNPDHVYRPPQPVHLFHKGDLRLPFVYGAKKTLDMESFRYTYVEDTSRAYPIRLFTKGSEYKVLGLFRSRLHLFGVEEPAMVFLFGTDSLGRDLFSRTVHASTISLTIGLIGVALSLFLGVLLGGIAGYYGGTVDAIILRVVEIIMSIPKIPLWMGLSAALPTHWSVTKTYFGLVIILSAVNWCGIARIIRGKFLQLREEDYVLAARIAGAPDLQIIGRHLVPSFISFIIVRATLGVPYMILGETSLSFLGLGMRPPAVSWGTLLKDAQNIRTTVLYPWLLIPAAFVILAVLLYNFVGDGMRDAADPYR
jgi:peptide/nickel transport system permease protein